MFRFSVQNMHPEIRDAHPKHQNLPAPPASHPKGQMDCTQERMSCVAASAPLETSHATVFLLLQLFGCLNYVCLTRLFFPSCAQISRHTFCVSHVDILRLNHFRSCTKFCYTFAIFIPGWAHYPWDNSS